MVCIPKINLQIGNSLQAAACDSESCDTFLSRSFHEDIVVRNTFIDFKSTSLASLRKSKSDSQLLEAHQIADCTTDNVILKALDEEKEGPLTGTTCTPRSQSESSSPFKASARQILWADAVDVESEPEDEYVPGFSKGNLLHEEGKCTPCRFWVKLGKCDLGDDCTFCHAGGHVFPKRLGKRARDRARNREVQGGSEQGDAAMCCPCESHCVVQDLCDHSKCCDVASPTKAKRLGKQARDRAKRRAAANKQ